ncbi:bifunctional oligoribonuclease/PAP phosphatase NrnA [Leptobacterium flavescens]|uniref:Bifunctional oligoribonuclease/PAP phosphatase NrnA n=1 Tax=Leptobacterium flavescens TaxID=472055 RepID=A0A6P0UFU6_9FLAO|nr:bifunctional oligoribonuclease/PAP phosphatase NrnA [Leptobacterium flavescens]NER12151.1 bifunctional oligoribonuclease/PAP phosphatase NrnA [Leptobacterium flavescens]
MKMNEIHKLKEELSAPKQIVIVPHKNPDGDAIGSTLGLFHYLRSKGQDAVVIAPNDYPDFLKWMPGNETVLRFDSETEKSSELIKKADLIFTLDFNSFGRVENMREALEASDATFVMIDHHQQPDDYARFMYSDIGMSSTCEMVYHFIQQMGEPEKIDKNVATCLYTGIMTDSGGSFRFPTTTSTTHRVVADLIDQGAENASIHEAVYDNNSLSRLQLLGCALRNMVVLKEFNTVYITLSKAELEAHNFKKGDTEGLVNYGLSLRGTKLAVIFIEDTTESYIKISFRSKGSFSVNEFARAHFGGGGHDNAAGGRSNLSMEETTSYFKEVLKNYKSQLE